MSDQPGRLRRFERTGVPLLAIRLVLGVIFLVMGLAKTGVLSTLVKDSGLIENAIVSRLVNEQTLSDKDGGVIALADPVDFLKLIHEYQIVPDRWSLPLNTMAAVLPWVEVLCGLFLLLGVALRGTALLLVLMLVGFTVLVTARAYGIHTEQAMPFCDITFDCGCGAGVVNICNKIPENLTLTLLSLFVLFAPTRRFCLAPRLIPGRKPSIDS